MKIAWSADGGADAGAAGVKTVLKRDCELAGADGLAIDKDGTFLIANRFKNRIQRVSKDGSTITTVSAGPPLDGPASLWIDDVAGARRLLITNSASTTTDGGAPRPALLSLPLP